MDTISTTTAAGRFTHGLLADVFAVLERHGYRLPQPETERDVAVGRSVMAVSDLVRVYEGGDR